jgi:outer membrane protein OmpA-like peptidoglycan-associated protein/flagellar hook assembly protein FlgD
MRRFFYIGLIVICSCAAAEARDRTGQNLLLYGNQPASAGAGGTGITGSTVDYFSINPASAATIERPALSLLYGGFSGYADPSLTLLLPSSYGVFGGSARFMTYDADEGLTRALRAKAGAGKQITERLFLGAAADMLYGEADGSCFYAGGVLGAIYRTGYEKKFGRGFGLYRPAFGLTAAAGIPMGDHASAADMNRLSMGYSFGFYKNEFAEVSFRNEVSAIHGYSSFPVTWGFETLLYRSFALRAGGSYPSSYGAGTLTCGAGYKFDARYFSASLDYALVRSRGTEFTHYLGLTAEFGELDRDAPAAIVLSSQQYISPNHDGGQDYALITLDVSDRSRIKGWRLQILDAAGAVIKEYKAPTRDMEEDLTVKEFFSRIISSRESTVVPDAVLWDGADMNGAIVPDGRYRYSFMTWDERDNYSERKGDEIVVDTTSPSVELSSGELLFSPNGDGKKDEFVITHKFVSAPDDEWEAGFTDRSGRKVRTYHWAGSNPVSQVQWDGRDDSGANLPEGLYSYFITSKDKAGNNVRKTVQEITLTRRTETADLYVSREYFSYLLDKAVMFRPVVSSKNGMESWRIVVEKEDGTPVKTLSGLGAVPDKVEWNVADDVALRIADGTYRYYLTTVYKSGSEPASFKKQITVDSTPPAPSIDFNPSLFSPDGDGAGDILTIIPSSPKENGVAEWSIDITYNGDKQRSILFKRFVGRGVIPSEIKWDGIGDRNELVESASDYYMVLSVTDRAGNTAKSRKETLPVDVLVMVTEGGLKIRISTIEFEFDSAIIGKKSYRILNRVAQILDRYRKYKIRIEGHTDDIGDDAYNLKLSEDRALSVRDYLVSKGIDIERLSLLGRGETSPLVPNKDDEARRKNRRVEFILEK